MGCLLSKCFTTTSIPSHSQTASTHQNQGLVNNNQESTRTRSTTIHQDAKENKRTSYTTTSILSYSQIASTHQNHGLVTNNQKSTRTQATTIHQDAKENKRTSFTTTSIPSHSQTASTHQNQGLVNNNQESTQTRSTTIHQDAKENKRTSYTTTSIPSHSQIASTHQNHGLVTNNQKSTRTQATTIHQDAKENKRTSFTTTSIPSHSQTASTHQNQGLVNNNLESTQTRATTINQDANENKRTSYTTTSIPSHSQTASTHQNHGFVTNSQESTRTPATTIHQDAKATKRTKKSTSNDVNWPSETSQTDKILTDISNTNEAEHFPVLNIKNNKRKKTERRKTKKEILSLFNPATSNKIVYFDIEMIQDATREYSEIESFFMQSTQRHYRVLNIEKIQNPYIKTLYTLRKKEYEIMYGAENVTETHVFHGTKQENVQNIIENNFNWRMHGEAKGHIFGKGVSFSPISNYASNYGDETDPKFMFVVSILKCHSCYGNRDMVVPPKLKNNQNIFYDTTEKPGGAVYVKYKDDEFYPMYLIEYSGSPLKKY